MQDLLDEDFEPDEPGFSSSDSEEEESIVESPRKRAKTRRQSSEPDSASEAESGNHGNGETTNATQVTASVSLVGPTPVNESEHPGEFAFGLASLDFVSHTIAVYQHPLYDASRSDQLFAQAAAVGQRRSVTLDRYEEELMFKEAHQLFDAGHWGPPCTEDELLFDHDLFDAMTDFTSSWLPPNLRSDIYD